MKPIDILKAAREILSKPENWTTGVEARDKNGIAVSPRSQDATCWCALGALVKASQREEDRYESAYRFLLREAHNLGAYCVGDYNDDGSRTHAGILKLFDGAIEQAQKE